MGWFGVVVVCGGGCDCVGWWCGVDYCGDWYGWVVVGVVVVVDCVGDVGGECYWWVGG